MIKKNKLYFAVFFTAIILAYFQTVRIDSPNYELKLKRHNSIIGNSIEYPYKYRLLNPYITNIWFTASKIVMPERAAFILAYFIQNILVYGFMLFALFWFFSLWFDDSGTLIAVLIYTVLVSLSLTGYDTLGDMTTAGVMAVGFIFIVKDNVKLLYPLIFISAFNELQSILLIAFYFFAKKSNQRDKKVWLNSILLVVLFVIAYAIIYLIRGGQAGGGDVQWFFSKDAAFNIEHKDWIALWFLMIAPLLYFGVKDFKAKPEFLRRSTLIVLPLFYFIAFFFIARLREIDKALTIFTILIPLALYSLIPKHIKTSSD
ncbi:MAG: hypothetical protein L0Y79_12495 [Chlorobi bacterium]|nr:hypothetical protein [Chlorobiota bacterium]MCI0716833.1 hypothetical protein [Chlorobiota bacterium]